MNKQRVIELRKSAFKAWEQSKLEERGVTFKRFFRRLKKNHLKHKGK